MDERELETLLNQRKYIKGRITNVGNLIAVTEPENLKNLEERLNALFHQYEEVQANLIVADLENYGPDGDTVERKYFELLGEIQNAFKRSRPASAASDLNTGQRESNSMHARSHENRLRLPKIELPNFDGNFKNWDSFRDLFSTLVHQNSDIPDIEKLVYLKSCLKGDVGNIVRNLDTSSANYQNAWDTLIKRYDNKMLKTNFHLESIFDLKKITKPATELKVLLNKFNQHLNSLKTLSGERLNDLLLIYVLKQKLDPESLQHFELQRPQEELPTLTDFIKYLEHRSVALEVVPKSEGMKLTKGSRGNTYTSLGERKRNSCTMCSGEHWLSKCPKFKNCQIKQRLDHVQEKQLCASCLGKGHLLDECKFKRFVCKKCQEPHHFLLHGEKKAQEEVKANPAAAPVEVVSHTNTACSLEERHVLMSTATVHVCNQGHLFPCRVLLDNASDKNYVTKAFLDFAKMTFEELPWQVGGIGGKTAHVNGRTTVTIQSRLNDFKVEAQFGVIDKITQPMPRATFPRNRIRWPRYVDLADPNFNERSEIDMLIGIEVLCEVLKKGIIDLPVESGKLVLQNTQFGWVFSGTLPMHIGRSLTNSAALVSQGEDLSETMSKFWKLEDVSQQRALSNEEKMCERLYVDSISRNDVGRYEVDLPIDTERLKSLGTSYPGALSCFLSLERRLQKNTQLYEEYKKFISEFLTLGHAHYVNPQPTEGYYMPHHAVFKAESSSTKLRVVFNASSKTSTGVSLNDVMLVGPVVQPDLISVILRFRSFQYAITADITKMYRQVNVKSKYQPLQRILWRNNPNEDIKCLQLSTVTYGTASASFLATRTLLQLVRDEGERFPLASQALEENSYVDDVLTGANDLHVAKCLQVELVNLLQKGCFVLHKWCSNSEEILVNVPPEKRELGNVNLAGNADAIKTLGLIWEPRTDVFRISFSIDEFRLGGTKREILSCIARIFDPIGFVAPVTVYAKIVMQMIWKENLPWDDTAPEEILRLWRPFFKRLETLKEIKIPRCILGSKLINIQLHGFADASTKAYGACVYIRTTKSNGTISTNLVCAKSKVAPLKPATLPRLELCAAVLLSRLVQKVRLSFNSLTFDTHLWSDSTIALCWIKSDPARWHVFVANRVAEIQDLTSKEKWRHVSSDDNPADLVSRGVEPQALQEARIWWYGPEWLCLPECQWPHCDFPETTQDLPECRNISQTCVGVESPKSSPLIEEFERFSKFSRLRRVFAFVLRFINNTRIKQTKLDRLSGPLLTKELIKSEELIVKTVQAAHFQIEIRQLTKLMSEPNQSERFSLKRSKLKFLNPLLDKSGVLRVGGRLKHAPISVQQRHPMILPPKSHVTKLILIAEHERLLHAGSQLLLANVRLKYWPINARNEIRSIVHRCIKCYRFRAETASQIMADLPRSRVTPSRPFLFSGVDFAGPFSIKQSRLRKALTTKGYICLFVCMASKALHLELVPDLTTKAFLNALRRFTSRRGKCQKLYSDNGTSFKGAHNELNAIYKNINANEVVHNHLSEENIKWEFIPPSSPHWGGIWESGVKSVKHHLRRTLTDSCLTYEEFNTVLIQIEGILNSRPLCELSNDPTDLTPLTPSHFLIGDVITGLPDPSIDFETIPENRLSSFQKISKLKTMFWKRWSSEYLSSLQPRKKWHEITAELQENQLVLGKDDNLPPQAWSLARIIKLFPGKDGHVRSVLVRTSKGIYTRPITKICPLPFSK